MRELDKIIAEADKSQHAGSTVALATVIGIEGSGYRLPGARMLIVDGKWVAGSISGGCLEDDVIMRSEEALRSKRALVTTYDTTGDDDIVFGVGLGCKGIIEILIEPIGSAGGAVDFIDFAKDCLSSGVVGIAATVVRIEGRTDCTIGRRLLSSNRGVYSNIRDRGLEADIWGAISRLPPTQRTGLARCMTEFAAVDIFVERIEPPTPLLIFGAGHDAMPIVRLAKELGWHVTLVDHRAAYATRERFPLADRIVTATPEQVLAQSLISDGALAVVMTHNYLRDLRLLELLVASRARYIGLLGPRQRSRILLDELAGKGVSDIESQFRRIYSPVGLDIGSESPAEVALSILAEMQAVISGRAGGFLRERQSSIHQRVPTLTAA